MYMVYANTIYTYMYKMIALQMEIFYYLFWAVHELRLGSCGLTTVSKGATCSHLNISLPSHAIIVCILGVACVVRPHPDYWMCALKAAMSLLGTICVQVKVWLSISLLTWYTWKALVQQRTLLRICSLWMSAFGYRVVKTICTYLNQRSQSSSESACGCLHLVIG